RRAHGDAADRTRSAAGLDGAAETARRLNRNCGQICPRPPRPHRGRASVANGQNFREVGLHQCPSERKGEGVPVRSLRVPSHVPSHPQTAAKVRGFSLTASGFTAETDWLLEETGFELTVPPEIGLVWCFASSASRGAADEAVVKGRLLGQPGPDMPEVSSSLLDPQQGVLGPINSIHMLLGGLTVRRAVISSV